MEKAVLGRGPKFALSTAIDKNTKEDCRTAFARFAYQYKWSVARGDSQDQRRGGNVDETLPTFPRVSNVHVPPPNAAIENKMRRLYHTFTRIVEGVPERRQEKKDLREWSNIPREERPALQALTKKPVALMPSDKGGEFCAVEHDAYMHLARSHLADTTQQTVEGHLSSEEHTNEILEKLRDDQHTPGLLPSPRQNP